MTKNIETVYVDMVKERSNGELIIEFIGGPEAIPKIEQVDAVSKGVLEMAFAVVGEYTHVVPAVRAFTAAPYNAWEQREKGIYDFWLKEHKKSNLMYLGQWAGICGYVVYVSEKPVRTIADFAGLSILPTAEMDLFVKAIGGIPVAVNAPEIYTALERGMLDAYIWSDVGTMWGWEKVTKYVVDEPWYAPMSMTTLINLDVFQGLPQHLQDVLVEVSIEYEHVAQAYFDEVTGQERQRFLDAGTEYIKLPPSEAEWWVEAMPRLHWEFRKPKMPPELAEEVTQEVLLK